MIIHDRKSNFCGLAIGSILVILLLQACASTEQFKKMMDSNLGLTIDQVQDVFGYSNIIRELEENRKAYTWAWVEQGVFPAMSTPTIIRSVEHDKQKTISINGGTYYPPEPYVLRCEFTFVVGPNRKVESWRAQGKGCGHYPGPGEILRSKSKELN